MKLIIFTHGNVAKEMVEASKMITGDNSFTEFMCLLPHDNVLEMTQSLLQSVGNEEALILVDFIGGSPFNGVFKIISSKESIHLISGVNMPMVLSAIDNIEDGRLDIEAILSVARESIKYATHNNYQEFMKG